jgi:MFS family permease
MVAGMLTTFIASGRIVSRTGRYKAFPIAGTLVVAIGLALLATVGTSTGYGPVAAYMFVVGFGLGLVMQVLVVAVQNTVPHARLGTATSTATFFRTIGGAFGVAALGAVFNNRLLDELRAHAGAAEVRLLRGGTIVANPASISRLPQAARTAVVDAFSHSLTAVFVVSVPFAVVAFLLCWLLKETPLRTTAFVSTAGPRANGHAAPGAGAAEDRATAPDLAEHDGVPAEVPSL